MQSNLLITNTKGPILVLVKSEGSQKTGSRKKIMKILTKRCRSSRGRQITFFGHFNIKKPFGYIRVLVKSALVINEFDCTVLHVGL